MCVYCSSRERVQREQHWHYDIVVNRIHPVRYTYTYASDEPGAKVVAHRTEGGLGYQFDYQPQETIVTDNLGRTTRYGFDGEGDRKRLARQTDALGHTTQFVYNLYGHLMQHIDPLGRVSQYGVMSAVRISFLAEFQPRFLSNFSLSALDFDGVNARLVCCVVPVLLPIQAFTQASALSGADSPCELIFGM